MVLPTLPHHHAILPVSRDWLPVRSHAFEVCERPFDDGLRRSCPCYTPPEGRHERRRTEANETTTETGEDPFSRRPSTPHLRLQSPCARSTTSPATCPCGIGPTITAALQRPDLLVNVLAVYLTVAHERHQARDHAKSPGGGDSAGHAGGRRRRARHGRPLVRWPPFSTGHGPDVRRPLPPPGRGAKSFCLVSGCFRDIEAGPEAMGWA